MALFDNVTYTYYSETIGRQEVPNADEFDKYKNENILFLKGLYNDSLIVEREPNGIDAACCMMIEEDYKAAEIAAGAANVDTSETIGGYSHSSSAKAYEIQQEKDAKSTAAKKYKWLGLYCYIMNGAR